jgi:hypothetical protein
MLLQGKILKREGEKAKNMIESEKRRKYPDRADSDVMKLKSRGELLVLVPWSCLI